MSDTAVAWAPGSDDFRVARERIQHYIKKTPMLRAEALDRPNQRVLLKTENLQRSGAFKVRGAYNAVLAMNREARAKGVITFSSGNHGQAVALAARDVGIAEIGAAYPCTVVMPEGASQVKVKRTEFLGAKVVFCGKTTEDRKQKAMELALESGAQIIPAYDHRDVITGQGTLGPEIMDQWMGIPARTRRLSLVAAPVGGGGLMSGVAAGLRARGFGGRIVGVEPEAANDTFRSLEAGERVEIPAPETCCDALCAIKPGMLTFPIMQSKKVQITTIGEEQIKFATQWLLNEMKLLVEPSGAVAVAAWANGLMDDPENPATEESDVVLILSGGNVDPSVVAGWSS